MHKTLLLILAIIVNGIFSSAVARAADTTLDGAKKEAPLCNRLSAVFPRIVGCELEDAGGRFNWF
jgi:hypothetical protein